MLTDSRFSGAVRERDLMARLADLTVGGTRGTKQESEAAVAPSLRPTADELKAIGWALTADEHKAIRCALAFGVPPGSDPLLESAKAKLRRQETLAWDAERRLKK